MIKVGTFCTQPPIACVDSYKPFLIIRPKDAPRQWVDALDIWCRNAPEQERSKRLAAAQLVLQKYADPKNSTLDLSRFELTELPPGLWRLANLQELNVSQNFGLQKLPDDLDECVALRSIDASSCSIKEWPTYLSKLPSLETLLLDDNPGLRVSPEQFWQCRKPKNLSMAATRPRDFNDPPIRRLLPGETRGRAIVRSAPSSPKRPNDSFRTRSASPPAHATAPSVFNLLGFKRAHQLDKDFGTLQWPFRRGEPALKPSELDATGAPLMLSDRIFVPDEKGHFANLRDLLDLGKLKTGEKKYIWTVSKLGRLIISEEMQAGVNLKNGEEPQYIGHPAQVGGGRGRISGELLFKAVPASGRFSKFVDWIEGKLKRVAKLFRKAGLTVGFKAAPNEPLSGTFYINNASGRFSKFVDRNEGQLQRVAELFRKAGLAVETVYRKRDKLQPVAGLQASTSET